MLRMGLVIAIKRYGHKIDTVKWYTYRKRSLPKEQKLINWRNAYAKPQYSYSNLKLIKPVKDKKLNCSSFTMPID